MKRKLLISLTFILITVFSVSIFKYVQFNNYRLRDYALKVLFISNDIEQASIMVKNSKNKVEYDSYARKIIENLNSLGSILYSGNILLGGEQIYDSHFIIYTKKLEEGLKYGDMNEDTVKILDNIIAGTDILCNNFIKCYGSEKNISKKEILKSIEECMKKIQQYDLLK